MPNYVVIKLRVVGYEGGQNGCKSLNRRSGAGSGEAERTGTSEEGQSKSDVIEGPSAHHISPVKY